jgi:hypothetical protein
MCNERQENGIFGGLMLKPSMVTTRNCNIILKCIYIYIYIANLSIHTTTWIYIYKFSIAIIGIQGVKILMENNCISCYWSIVGK